MCCKYIHNKIDDISLTFVIGTVVFYKSWTLNTKMLLKMLELFMPILENNFKYHARHEIKLFTKRLCSTIKYLI